MAPCVADLAGEAPGEGATELHGQAVEVRNAIAFELGDRVEPGIARARGQSPEAVRVAGVGPRI